MVPLSYRAAQERKLRCWRVWKTSEQLFENGKLQSRSEKKTCKNSQTRPERLITYQRNFTAQKEKFRAIAIENSDIHWDWSSSSSEQSPKASALLPDIDIEFEPDASSETKTRENAILPKIKLSTPLRLGEIENFNIDDSTVTEVNVSPHARSWSKDTQDDLLLFIGLPTSVEDFHQLIR